MPYCPMVSGMGGFLRLQLYYLLYYLHHLGCPAGSDSKESAYNAGDTGLIPGSGRSPGEWNGCSILAWRIPWTEEPGGLEQSDSAE